MQIRNKEKQGKTLQIQINDFFKEVNQFEQDRIKDANHLLNQIEKFLHPKIAPHPKIDFLRKTISRMTQAQSLDELKIYEENFHDIANEIQLNADTLGIDTWMNAILAYADACQVVVNAIPPFSGEEEEKLKELHIEKKKADEALLRLNANAIKLQKIVNKKLEKGENKENLADSISDIKYLQEKINDVSSFANKLQNIKPHKFKTYNEQLKNQINSIVSLATNTPDIYKYRNKNVNNYLVAQCKENIASWSIARSSYLKSMQELEHETIKEFIQVGLSGAGSVLAGPHYVYDVVSKSMTLASYAYTQYNTLKAKFSEAEIEKKKLTYWQKFKKLCVDEFRSFKKSFIETLNNIKIIFKQNPFVVCALCIFAMTVMVIPFLFFHHMVAILLISAIVSAAGAIFTLVYRAREEKTKDAEVVKRLEEHESDLNALRAIEEQQQNTAHSHFDRIVDFSKKHPWSIPLVIGGSIIGWKVAAVAAVAAGAKLAIGSSTLLIAKATGATTGGLVAAEAENEVVSSIEKTNSSAHVETNLKTEEAVQKQIRPRF